MAAIPLDQKVKAARTTWSEKGYQGASVVTKRLLEFWFKEEHFLRDGSEFRFWRAQREAIEALIYVYEVSRYHSLYSLSRNFGVSLTFDPTTDNWPKYCFKMATGSGKTFVMAMAIVWQYFNRFFATQNGCRYTSKFVLIAPNLIVLDRLDEAFRDNAIFREYPFTPPEWDADFDFLRIYQSQVSPPTARGVLYLTNVQQLYEAPGEEEVNALAEALGGPVVKGASISRADLQEALRHHDNLLVLNDEAHHVHSDDLEWNKAIASVYQGCLDRGGNGLTAQLDFSATPYTGSGDSKRFFPHILYDYPLAAAIRDGIVKRPKIGEIEHAAEPVSRDFVRKNRLQIDTGVEVFREFQRGFSETGKKPVLFVMTDITRNADKVGNYLEQTHHLKTLVIHTDTAGVITKKDLDKARQAARSIDTNEYHAIVSVMMLKEGWDVKNVCVVIPLRSYQSAILAEQTLGRGLRRIWPEASGLDEKLIVIDHPRFRELWRAEIRDEDLDIEIVKAREVYQPENIVQVDPAKTQFDIEIPVLSGGITRDVRRIADLPAAELPGRFFCFDEVQLPKIMYREKDLLTQSVELERELSFDFTDRYDIYLSAMTKAILSRCAASSQFAELVPKLRQYIETKLFDQSVDMADPQTVLKLNHIPVREKIRDVFVDAILKLQVVEEPYELIERFRVRTWNDGLAFHTSEPVYPAKRTVFAAGDRRGLPYPRTSEYERRFMQYLDDQKEEVLAYTKVLARTPLRIPYYDGEGYRRHYIPDFVVKTEACHYLIETKGTGWDDQAVVSAKEAAGRAWCARVSHLTGDLWGFAKILQSDFERYGGLPLEELMRAAFV
jgi:type III restriction enzyme